MSPINDKMHYKIAVSFSGENNEIVKQFCEDLCDNHGIKKEEIFYYPWHPGIVSSQVHADNVLRDIYYRASTLDVVLLSPEYLNKDWPNNVEWPAIAELINEGKTEKICLLEIGDIDSNALSKNGLFRRKAIPQRIDTLLSHEVAALIFKRYINAAGEDPNAFHEKMNSFIVDETKNFINDLSSLTVKIAREDEIVSINVLDQLKHTPREGKRIRIENEEALKATIQPRTVFDHMISLSYLASVIGMIVPKGDIPLEPQNIARLIAYHEMAEAIIGDIPSYTVYTSNIIPLSTIEKNKQEYYTNRFISLYADNKQLQSIGYLCNRLLPQNGKDKKELTKQMAYFKALDRLDCLIAIWRYIPFYRGTCNKHDLTRFVNTMSDFFSNERLQNDPVLSSNPNLFFLTSFVMNKQYALDYAEGLTLKEILDKESLEYSQMVLDALSYLIENVPLFVTN